MQPVLLTKKNPGQKDLEVAAKYGYFFNSQAKEFICLSDVKDSKTRIRDAYDFRDNISEVDYGWLYNYSDIFDKTDGVYMDYCHLYEEGNNIVAERVFKDCIFDFFMNR